MSRMRMRRGELPPLYNTNPTNQQLCDLSVAKKGSMLFPAANKPGAQAYYQQLYTGLGKFSAPSLFPDVTVVAANQVAPVEAAVAGQQYRVLLENFTGVGDVVVQLVQGTSQAGETVATVSGGMKKGQVAEVRASCVV